MSDDESRADRLGQRTSRRRSRADKTSQTNESPQTGESDDTHNTSVSNEKNESSGTDNSSQSSNGTQTDQTDDANETSVRDRKHVAMYLPEDLAEDVDFRFDELQVEYRREHDEKMTKNGEFYPAVARAIINDTTLREELDLDAKD